jgi:AraC-like DNA-binding protein/mannose-6-phosphate isomerase-like protein (cupin superfamily)
MGYNEINRLFYHPNGIRYEQYHYPAKTSCFPMHWHDRLEILHMISGTLHIHMNGEYMTLGPGQTLVVMPHMNHYGFTEDEAAHYHMLNIELQKYINSSATSLKYMTPLINSEVTFTPIIDNPIITKALEELFTYLAPEPDINSLCSMGKMYEIMGLLYQYCRTDSKTLRKPDNKFSAVLEYIGKHFTEDISTKDISEKFKYDETYFCRRFKELTGITVTRHLRQLRMEKAQSLLVNTTEEIKTIAWKCGYSDVSYFSKHFKRQFKMSPAEYRKKEKQ